MEIIMVDLFSAGVFSLQDFAINLVEMARM